MTPTLVEIKHALLTYFQQENSINPATQAELVKFDCDDKALKSALVAEALKELEGFGITRKIEIMKLGEEKPVSTYWILVKPLGMYERTISFGYDTLSAVANFVNGYLAQGGNTRDIVDATDIKERDIQKLVLIAESLLPKEEKSS